MTASNVCNFQCLNILLVVLMESSNRFNSHNIYLYGSAIYLGQRLNLDIISPYTILGLSLDVLLDIFNEEVLKKLFFLQNIFHAYLSDLVMVSFLSIELVGNRSKEAITILSNFPDDHVVLIELPYHLEPLLSQNFLIIKCIPFES